MSIVWAGKYTVVTRPAYFHNESWIAVCRIMQGFVLGNAHLTFFLHMAVTIVDIMNFDDAAHHIGQYENPSYFVTTQIYAYRQVVMFCFMSGLQWLKERASYRAVEATCEAFRANEVERGMEHLLSGICEAVIHLASDFSIVGPARGLRALLLLPTHMETVTKKLQDYMSSEDAERFNNHLLSGTISPNSFLQLPPHPLHVSLRDETYRSVPVEVFCVSIADLNGNWRHIVGIKDNSECAPDEMGPPHSPCTPNNNDAEQNLEEIGLPNAPSEARLNRLATNSNEELQRRLHLADIPERSSYCSSISESTLSAYNVEEASCRFSLDDFQKDIAPRLLDYSTAFGVLLGPSLDKDTNLLTWMQRRDVDKFRNFIQTACNVYVSPDHTDSDLPHDIKIVLHPPHLKAFKMVMSTKVAITFIDTDTPKNSDASDIDNLIVKVTLHHSYWHQYSSRRERPPPPSLGTTCEPCWGSLQRPGMLIAL